VAFPFQVQGAFLYACLFNPQEEQVSTQNCRYFTPMSYLQAVEASNVNNNLAATVPGESLRHIPTGTTNVVGDLSGRANLHIKSLGIAESGSVDSAGIVIFDVELENRGIAESTPSSLEFYQSQWGEACSTRGQPLFVAEVPAINSLNSISREWSYSVPWRNGEYCYAACLKANSGESTSKTCSMVKNVEITTSVQENPAHASPADIRLGYFESHEATVSPGGNLELRGNALITLPAEGRRASSVRINYYQSTDSVKSNNDIRLGSSRSYDASLNDDLLNFSATQIAPATEGIYHYYACTPPSEFNTVSTNDCTGVYSVRVTNQPQIDLEVVSVDRSFLDVISSDEITLSALVRNNGLTASESVFPAVYHQCDTDRFGWGTLGQVAIGSVAPESTVTVSQSYQYGISTPPGANCSFRFCVGSQEGDVNPENNCKQVRYEVGDDGSINVIAMQARSGALRLDTGHQVDNDQLKKQAINAQRTSPTLKKLPTGKVTPKSRSGFGKRHLEQKLAVAPSTTASTKDKPKVFGGKLVRQSPETKTLIRLKPTPKTTTAKRPVSSSKKVTATTTRVPDGKQRLAVVTKPKMAPNLVLGSIARKGKATIKPGDKVTVQLAIYNKGQAKATASELKLLRLRSTRSRSSGSTISTKSISAIDKGKSRRYRFQVTVPNRPGKMIIGACAKVVANEPKRSDNCARPLTILIAR